MNIINKPTVTYEQCEAWLKSKTTANPLALQNLPLLWKAAIRNNIDPAVLISQCMVETGFFKFGGIIDASFHNTCGLKTTKGGGNYVANAHMRFDSWEDGINAHSDHLALYAGSPTCPKYSPECASHQNLDYKGNGTTKDPRHFTYLHGKCKTVKDLTGAWATDPQYDQKLMKMIKEIQSTKVEEKTCPTCNAQKYQQEQQKTTIKKPVVTEKKQNKVQSTKQQPEKKQNKVQSAKQQPKLNKIKDAFINSALGPFKKKK